MAHGTRPPVRFRRTGRGGAGRRRVRRAGGAWPRAVVQAPARRAGNGQPRCPSTTPISNCCRRRGSRAPVLVPQSCALPSDRRGGTGASPFGIACRGILPGELDLSQSRFSTRRIDRHLKGKRRSDAALRLLVAGKDAAVRMDGWAGRAATDGGRPVAPCHRTPDAAAPARDRRHARSVPRAGLVGTMEIAEGEPELLVALDPGRRLRLPLFTAT